MAFLKVNVFVVAILFVAVSSLHAHILNGSFEDFVGEPNGPVDVNEWVSNGTAAQVYDTYTATRNDYIYHGTTPPPPGISVPVAIEPNEGQHFLRLDSLDKIDEPNCTQLAQIIDVNAGECIRGVYYFDAEDYLDYNDTAIIMLMPVSEDPCSGPAEIVLAQTSISEPHIGDFGGMLGWKTFSRTFDSNDAGRYMLVLKIGNIGDHQLASFLLVDAIEIVPAPPPPPCSYALIGDINRDCKVDFLDFAIMAEHWLIDCNTEPVDPVECPLI